MADYGHIKTEQQLTELENRISTIYKAAADELKEKIEDYFELFAERDKKYRARVDAGEMTEERYKQWRLAQIGRGARFEKLRSDIAERYTSANEAAVAYVNDATPTIYSLNRNYAAYTIEKVSGDVGFTLWDEQTVKRLIVEQPDLMPCYPSAKALKRGIDLDWGKKKITAQVTSGILQGESIKGLANRLQSNIPDMNRDSAIRTARTAVTGAQNAGRMDSYAHAAKKGIRMEREWVATLDNRTRHAHQLLDGRRAPIDKPFKVDGYEIMYPGDSSAPAYLVYNCRCTMIAAVEGVDTSDALRRDKDGLLSDMTYAQWEASKRGYSASPISKYNVAWKAIAKDVTQEYQSAAQRTGKIRYESGYKQYTHKAEIKAAEILHSAFGGKIVLLNESNKQGEKTPDYLWNRKSWEQKTISSAKAADSALRGAMKQIKNNPGGVVFSCADDIGRDELSKILDSRALRGDISDFDIITLKYGRFWFARRYKN